MKRKIRSLISYKEFKSHIESIPEFKNNFYLFDFSNDSKKYKTKYKKQINKFGFHEKFTWNVDVSIPLFIHFLCNDDQLKSLIKHYITCEFEDFNIIEEKNEINKLYNEIVDKFLELNQNNIFVLSKLIADIMYLYDKSNIINTYYHRLEFENSIHTFQYWIEFIETLYQSVAKNQNKTDATRIINFTREYINILWW